MTEKEALELILQDKECDDHWVDYWVLKTRDINPVIVTKYITENDGLEIDEWGAIEVEGGDFIDVDANFVMNILEREKGYSLTITGFTDNTIIMAVDSRSVQARGKTILESIKRALIKCKYAKGKKDF